MVVRRAIVSQEEASGGMDCNPEPLFHDAIATIDSQGRYQTPRATNRPLGTQHVEGWF